VGPTERVRELDADPDVQGVVVTHGTGTLEESAYFLDLCYDGDTPVVFTGAMRNPSLASPDGPANLLASVAPPPPTAPPRRHVSIPSWVFSLSRRGVAHDGVAYVLVSIPSWVFSLSRQRGEVCVWLP